MKYIRLFGTPLLSFDHNLKTKSPTELKQINKNKNKTKTKTKKQNKKSRGSAGFVYYAIS